MKVTMEYIARMANVSKATVSRVINNKTDGVGEATRTHVLEILEQFNYKVPYDHPCEQRGKSKTIGVIIPDITNPFFSELVKVIDEYASSLGYILLLCNTNSSAIKEDKCITALTAQKVDGVILVSTVGDQVKGCELLKKYNIPYVLLDRKTKNALENASVYLDNEYAMFKATDYLIKNGNKNIAIFLGPSYLSASEERLEGYKNALENHNIEYDKKLVIWGDFTYQSGYNSTIYLKETGREFTAILAASDIMAIGALNALDYLQLRVPQDIEVVGFDNIPMSEMVQPALTTLAQPIKDLGEKAVGILIETIETGSARVSNIRLEAKLIIRQSTK